MSILVLAGGVIDVSSFLDSDASATQQRSAHDQKITVVLAKAATQFARVPLPAT